MKLLLDTQILLWAAGHPKRLSPAARKLLNDPRNELRFSAASLWEVAIKNSLGRDAFTPTLGCSAGVYLTTGTPSFPSPTNTR